MPDRNTRSLLLTALLLIAFAVGVWQLFQLRFESGDIYPPYSSLRSDPLGTRLLYAGLARFDQLSVDRSHIPLSQLSGDVDTVLFFLGVTSRDLERSPRRAVEAVERFVVSGGRLVLGLQLSRPPPSRDTTTEDNTDSGQQETPPKTNGTGEEDGAGDDDDAAAGDDGASAKRPTNDADDQWVSPAHRWGFTVEMPPLTIKADALARNIAPPNLPLPRQLPWPTGYGLRPDPALWTELFEREEQTVVMQRRYGRGEIILLSDSYCLSNEAVRNHRPTAFLAWLVGNRTTVRFEETHLGILRSQGIASLARKYRLHGVLASLLVVALLFIWKNATTLLPVSSERLSAAGASPVPDANAGLISLLRRHIRPSDLLAVCLAEWQKGGTGGRSAAMKAAIDPERLRVAAQGKPVDAYRRITNMLVTVHGRK